MKKCIALLCFLLCLLCLTACGECSHQWQAASCETAKTCTLCGATEGAALGHTWAEADCVAAKTCTACQKTEGEALGHTWADADCVSAKTCAVCNATEGTPLGHDWAPANFQAPATCSRCACTEGEALPGAYDSFGVTVLDTEIGKEYDYKTACYVAGHTTVGKLTWENYQVFVGDEAHEAVEGYVWHSVTVKILFSDRDAGKYGFTVKSALDDYFWVANEGGGGYTDAFSVSYLGTVYDQCLMANGQGIVSDWVDGACTYTAEFAWRVPENYDGFLILFYNPAANLDDLLQAGSADLLAFRFA